MSEIRQIQVDGVNYDLVITEDEVSATRAEQAAAQSRQFANESVAARNSASSYADAAEDAADRAEAIVGGEFVSYGQDQGLSSEQKQQARDNIGVATSSNPNLLDNAWFINPVNTRGKSSYGASEYTIDRWRTWADISVTLAGGGLSLTSTNAGGGLFQYLDNGITAIAGKNVTFSAIIDGVLYSCTGVFTKPAWIATTVPNSGVSIVLVYPDEYPNELISASVRLDGAISTPVIVQAMKLEIGAVSTLLQDGPPNYGIELAKSIYSKADPNDYHIKNGFGRSNRNLLDNAYFIGGGSQQANTDALPINQNLWTTYIGSYSTIDRWELTDTNGSVEVLSDGLRIVLRTQFLGFQQCLPPTALIDGETYTLSVQRSGTIYTYTFVLSSTNPQNIPEGWLGITGVYTYVAMANGVWWLLLLDCARNEEVVVDRIQRVKLELGTISTLKNDAPPNFEEEYIKCVSSGLRKASNVSNKYIVPSTNENILDNAYFIGGGTQNGWARFPINQRLGSNYPGGSLRYTIDRWIATSALQLDFDWNHIYLSITGTGDANFSQPFDNTYAQRFVGKVLTGSLWFSDETVLFGSFICPDAPASGWSYTLVAENEKCKLIWAVHQTYRFEFFVQMKTNFGLKAAKLEYGTRPTIKNGIPTDFDAELRRCQGYFTILYADQIYQSFGLGIFDSVTSTTGNFTVSLPLPRAFKHATANVSLNNLVVFDGTGFNTINGVLLARIAGTIPVASIVLSVNGTFSNGQTAMLCANGVGAYIQISADI